MKESAGKKVGVLIIVENLPVPFDRRVWQEALTLNENGYTVTVICPIGKGYEAREEELEGIRILRYGLPHEAKGLGGYVVEYAWSLAAQFVLSCKTWISRRFDVIHACNPPDNIFFIGAFFKLFGVKFIFDHHDINPELYVAKFGRRGLLYRLMLLLERLTFMTANVSIATNESYREIAITRGGMDSSRVFVVRSGPDLRRMRLVQPNVALKNHRQYLVGYVGVMGQQEGIDLLLRSIKLIVEQFGRKDIQFGLVGGGTELESMRAYAKSLGIDEYVTFFGRVPDSVLLEALCTSDLCVNPDLANEMNDKSTMNKIVEYMALGKPIVQFDLTEGRRSALEASVYARPNDEADFARHIVSLIDDAPRREKMGEFGRRRVENELQWVHEAPKLLAAYRTALTP
jgi:glycosyltransferase involved in cell wall biosynthesis